MLNGEKTKAHKIIFGAFACLKKENPEQEPLEIFKKAVKELMPELETEKIRLGGTSQLVPKEVKPERSLCLALR